MGNSFSATEYREQIVKFSTDALGSADEAALNQFLAHSEDFYNMFNNSSLEDFRKVKEDLPENLSYLISYVSSIYGGSFHEGN